MGVGVEIRRLVAVSVGPSIRLLEGGWSGGVVGRFGDHLGVGVVVGSLHQHVDLLL